MVEYQQWIADNVKGDGYAQCDHYTRLMATAFSELRRAKGYYHCPIWGRRTHWWLVTATNVIVDPTKTQFPSKGIGEYEELSDEYISNHFPVGKCANCGKEIHKNNGYDSTMICSEECATSYRAYLGNI